MKIIIAPDKFKGSLSSLEACRAIAQGISQVNQEVLLHCFPMADGGDGFAEVMQYYTATETITCTAADPLNRPMEASYQWNASDKTAVIELAAASGLVLLLPEERQPLQTSTYGTGLLILDAINRGAAKIILGIGGSATTDAGTGILSALGYILKGEDNAVLAPCGGNLELIREIVPPAVLPAVPLELACDVDNVLYGPEGAAFVYAPQKGATPEQVQLLDKGLRHFAGIIQKQTGRDLSAQKSMGAAGGIAAGLSAFLRVSIQPGTDIIMNASHITPALPGAGLIITGEGRIDGQSQQGKLISSITAMGSQYHIPVIAFCGSLQLQRHEIKALGLAAAYALEAPELTVEYSIRHAAALLQKKAAAVIPYFLSANNRQS